MFHRRHCEERSGRSNRERVGRVLAEGVTRRLGVGGRRITPEPVIGPRFARTRWAQSYGLELEAAQTNKTARHRGSPLTIAFHFLVPSRR